MISKNVSDITELRQIIQSMVDTLSFDRNRPQDRYTTEIRNVIFEIQQDLHIHAGIVALTFDYMKRRQHEINMEIARIMIEHPEISKIKNYESKRREAQKFVDRTDLAEKLIEAEVLYTLHDSEYRNAQNCLIAAESLKKNSGD